MARLRRAHLHKRERTRSECARVRLKRELPVADLVLQVVGLVLGLAPLLLGLALLLSHLVVGELALGFLELALRLVPHSFGHDPSFAGLARFFPFASARNQRNWASRA